MIFQIRLVLLFIRTSNNLSVKGETIICHTTIRGFLFPNPSHIPILCFARPDLKKGDIQGSTPYPMAFKQVVLLLGLQ